MIAKIKISKKLREKLDKELENIDYTMLDSSIQIDARFGYTILTTAASDLNLSAIHLLCESLTSSNQEVRKRIEKLVEKVVEAWSTYTENLFWEAKEKMLNASKAGSVDARRFLEDAERNK